jgi:hypothetical protein
MMKNKPDPWHFARPGLAKKYLQTFQIGLISAQALFASRRMGKSEFLEQDLIPAAQRSGLLTAYLNLWDAREHPRGALITALARASSPRGLSALIKKLKAPLKKVKASAKVSGIAEGSLEAELTEDPTIAGPEMPMRAVLPWVSRLPLVQGSVPRRLPGSKSTIAAASARASPALNNRSRAGIGNTPQFPAPP